MSQKPANIPSIGIDSGSVAIKGALMRGEELLELVTEPTGADPAGQCRRMISALKHILPEESDMPVCATGYGREGVCGAQEAISEIFANALGTGWTWRNWLDMYKISQTFHENLPDPAHQPAQFRTIVDVGGQDSKVITFGADGVVQGFAMNDRCAAGTGRFLQELAVVLDLDGMPALDRLAVKSDAPCRIASTCTVFAESEVVSMVSGGVSEADIAGGMFRAVAERVGELAESLSWGGPVLFDGGAARFSALREALEERLRVDVAVPACAQHITAIGAAIYAG